MASYMWACNGIIHVGNATAPSCGLQWHHTCGHGDTILHVGCDGIIHVGMQMGTQPPKSSMSVKAAR